MAAAATRWSATSGGSQTWAAAAWRCLLPCTSPASTWRCCGFLFLFSNCDEWLPRVRRSSQAGKNVPCRHAPSPECLIQQPTHPPTLLPQAAFVEAETIKRQEALLHEEELAAAEEEQRAAARAEVRPMGSS